MEETQFINTNNILDFITAIQKLPETAKTEMLEKYAYIWAKCSMMLNLGFKNYATGDFFSFPNKSLG